MPFFTHQLINLIHFHIGESIMLLPASWYLYNLTQERNILKPLQNYIVSVSKPASPQGKEGNQNGNQSK